MGVDGSGGWYRWGAGLTDWTEEVEHFFGGLNRNLGALMAMRPEEKQFCDAMIAEALAMYFALNYVKKIYGGKAKGFLLDAFPCNLDQVRNLHNIAILRVLVE